MCALLHRTIVGGGAGAVGGERGLNVEEFVRLVRCQA